MNRVPTLRDRFRYQFDNHMSRGTSALIGLLALASLGSVLVFGLVVYATNMTPVKDGDPAPEFTRVMWSALMRTLDAGTMGGDEGSWPFLFTMLGVTLAGVFIVSTFIGVLTSGLGISLLHLRDMGEKKGKRTPSVSEMYDMRNRRLAEVAKPDDFVVGDRIVSLMLAQISENKRLNAVFKDLFDPEGAEIYLKPATSYVTPGKAVNFYTVLESAKKKNEVAFGYRIAANSTDPNGYGVVVNPEKSAMVTFSAADKIVVIAES